MSSPDSSVVRRVAESLDSPSPSGVKNEDDEGFNGCLAQFRANGYSEEEHPDLFLDVEQDLADMLEDEDSEERSSSREEAPTS
ncbi:hypothetical protein F511_35750 [Dorcoceras hygrometricum]|uniref:Uncharacterized protein n=1 Tax=Dorcoceras hygrometricum TaxID=472368 RepID=A0A2Z7ARW8_9LAMI|nr:hypothetical protein F511_35750 [Dorcoceras hygrometricum]